MIVAHFLGLDHIGHTLSSINNNIYNNKMINISNYLIKLSNKLRNDTLLIVVGDHGMK